MGIARSILGIRVVFLLLIVVAAVVLSALSLVSMGKRIESFVEQGVDKYDAYLPEITIKQGHASIRDKQPYFVDTGDKDLVIVIDTREGKRGETLDYLKDAHTGAVLGRDSITTKSQGRIQIIPLNEFPDMVINSHVLQDLVQGYFPMVMRVAAIMVAFYVLFAKLFQIFMLALVPYVAARSYNAGLSYGDALKMSTVAMVPPAMLEILLGFVGVGIPGWFIIYFVMYLAVLFVLIRDFIRSAPPDISTTESINP